MKEKLRLPAALAVVVIVSGCSGGTSTRDAAPEDAPAVADAGAPDAGCEPFEEYNPVTMMCEPLV